MTSLNLPALEALHAAASPAPWTDGKSYESIISPTATDDRVTRDAEGYGGPLVCESLFGYGDRALILALRNAAPELIRLARIGQSFEANKDNTTAALELLESRVREKGETK